MVQVFGLILTAIAGIVTVAANKKKAQERQRIAQQVNGLQPGPVKDVAADVFNQMYRYR